MGKIIVIGSQKGGVGKTTTTLNLAYSLREMGKKVLTVDFDSQANLTTCYGIEDTGALEYTIGHLMMPDCPEWLLPEAKKEWERLADLMNQMGILTEVDMAAFAAYCQSYARWKEAQEHIDSEGSTFETDKGYQQQTPWVGIANTNQKLMLQAASEFGLTPSSRSRIVAGSAKGKELEDEMEALLGGDS